MLRLAPDQILPALQRKLLEESGEVIEAVGDDVVEEIGDVVEVLRAIAAGHQIEWSAIEAAREKKCDEAGAFRAGVWLTHWYGE